MGIRRRSSRGPIGSYYQLAFVVPATAIVFLAGGVVALINGYGGAGALALALGLVVTGFIIWFVRLPVRHDAARDEADRTP